MSVEREERIVKSSGKMREGLRGEVYGECWVEETCYDEVRNEDDANLVFGAMATSSPRRRLLSSHSRRLRDVMEWTYRPKL